MMAIAGIEQINAKTDWPPQAELILSALEAGQFVAAGRRRQRRSPYRVRAELRLFSDGPVAQPWPIFTRDIDSRGLGFISPHRLPLGYGGQIELPGPSGQLLEINCTVYRCREAAPGWYEGAVSFNREQSDFGGLIEAHDVGE